MGAVSDILKILDQIPIWKKLKEQPARIDELEKRVQALEKSAVPKIAMGKECPKCGEEMKVTDERPDPMFGFSSLKVHDMECPNCEYKTQRQFQPGSGYK